MSFKFIHTADLHLDAPLRTIALRDEVLAHHVGVASRAALTRLVDLCIDEQVDFLLIAGDLWDGEYSSTKTPRFLKQELLRLNSAGIRCFLIRGNHDALSRRTGELDAPQNTIVFGHPATTEELTIRNHRVAIHGLSFREVHAPENPLQRYPAAISGSFNIGMLHTSLNGSPAHDRYAPVSLPELDQHGYHYWALGHIHRRVEHIGKSTIVMPGIPQGRDIGEAGSATVTLINVTDDNAVSLSQHSVASLRFERVEVDCAGVDHWSDLLARLGAVIREAAEADRFEEHLVLRPVLTGDTALAWRMARDRDVLSEEARAMAGDLGVWIDKLELHMASGQAAAATGLPEALTRTIVDQVRDDGGLAHALMEEGNSFVSSLPAEIRDLLGNDPQTQQTLRRELLDEGLRSVLSRLSGGGDH